MENADHDLPGSSDDAQVFNSGQRTVSDRYELVHVIGRGAMGAVYLVKDRETGEYVALKKLLRIDAESVLRLKREFRALADMNHPNLVKLYDLGRDNDGWFVAMEHVAGEDLLTHIRADAETITLNDDGSPDGPPPKGMHARVASAFYQLACGVEALHRAGMLHRDLKPSNVLVDNGRVVVLDFGLVRSLDRRDGRVTMDGAVYGTPAYMAPEQATGGELTEATDWYAFGAMLYEALTGQLPSGTGPV